MADLQLYQQLILDHNRSPKNFRKLENPTHQADGFNPLCGDRFQVFLRVDDQGVVSEVGFTGQGCAISKASASLMTAAVLGKPVTEALRLADDFRDLLMHQLSETDTRFEGLGKLKIFTGIWQYPARVKCAGLAWHALKAALNNQQVASTE